MLKIGIQFFIFKYISVWFQYAVVNINKAEYSPKISDIFNCSSIIDLNMYRLVVIDAINYHNIIKKKIKKKKSIK